MNYEYLVVYVDKSGEQVSIPFYDLKDAKKFAKIFNNCLIIDIRKN
jgi:hypothetical protein